MLAALRRPVFLVAFFFVVFFLEAFLAMTGLPDCFRRTVRLRSCSRSGPFVASAPLSFKSFSHEKRGFRAESGRFRTGCGLPAHVRAPWDSGRRSG
ncbi:MAG: hypothetical protein Kow0062_10310 [Acidobacteriota bacterium]